MIYLFIFNSESSFSKNNSKLYFKTVVIKNKVVANKTMSYLESCVLMAAFVLYLLDRVPCSPWHV